MLNGLRFILPEVVLALTAFYLIILTVLRKRQSRATLTLAALAGGVVALLALVYLDLVFVATEDATVIREIFYGSLDIDSTGIFFRYLSFALFLVVVMYSHFSKEMDDYLYGEYLILLSGVSVGVNFLAMSADTLMLFLSLESISLISYLLTGMIPKNKRANEAALKYILFGALSSALMLLGLSWLYGITHTTRVAEIIPALAESGVAPIAWQYALVLIFAGLAFKTALVPFHFWTPDVYQAAPFPVATFFSIGPKAAGFAVMMRLFSFHFQMENLQLAAPVMDFLVPILIATAVVTMSLGNLIALRQENIKRMLAYSSIAHAGYILTGFLAFSSYGNRAVAFSLLVYFVMNGGAFMLAGLLWQKYNIQEIKDFRGLAWRGKVPLTLSVLLALFLFSLAGLPPFAGFIGKWYLFAAAIEKGFLGLVIVAVLNSVIAFYYYARVVKEMFLLKPEEETAALDNTKPNLTLNILFHTMGILVVVLGLFFSPVFNWLQNIIP